MLIAATGVTAILFLIAAAAFYSFVAGVLFGVPYLPTLDDQRQQALKLLNLKPGQTLYEPGCGDGRMLREAARHGLNAVGYEISPFLYLIAKIVTRKYRRQVKVHWGNMWKADLSEVDGIYAFLLTKLMPRLDAKIAATGQPIKLVSYTFKIPNKKPTKEAGPLFLYKY